MWHKLQNTIVRKESDTLAYNTQSSMENGVYFSGTMDCSAPRVIRSPIWDQILGCVESK
jgi:hypothetical protein